MAEREPSQTDKVFFYLEGDLKNGSHQTFDYLVRELQRKGKTEEDIFTLAGIETITLDLGIGEKKIFRLFLREELAIHVFDIWPINKKGETLGNIYTFRNFPFHRKTEIFGSKIKDNGHRQSYDINPSQLALYLNEAFSQLNSFNWRLIKGQINIPQGQV